MDLYPHPVFDVELPKWWRYQAQMPPGVLLFLVPILVAMLLPQRWIRPYLLIVSLLGLWLTWGPAFAGAILGAVAVGWVMCLAGRAAARRGPKRARSVLIGGWILTNGFYFSMFLLPIDSMLRDAAHLDILLFCGPAFLLLRVLHVLTDACRGEDVGSLRPDRFALFLLFAPTFRLGPVTRYRHLNAELDGCKARMSWRMCLWGAFRVLFGLFQLVLVDEVIDEWLVDPYGERAFFFTRKFFQAAPELTSAQAWLGMYAIAMRFLLGFEGYSHIVLGLCLLIGIRLPENFLWPHFVSNLQTFWRRWHISLGGWLRDYVYIPLGGRDRRTIATLVVFVYCFAWHQPTLNMLAFALLHTAGLAIYHGWRRWVDRQARRKTRLFRVARRLRMADGPIGSVVGGLITFHFWAITLLVLFDVEASGLGVMKRMVGVAG